MIQYILQVKDRHNANILIDKEGHIIHIDFGFMLTNSPLKGMALENAPFKLNSDFIEVLGGEDSEGFRRFRKYFQRGFYALHKNVEKIVLLVQMIGSAQRDLPCFRAGGVKQAVKEIRERLQGKTDSLLTTKGQCMEFADQLIMNSYDNWRHIAYDHFQYCCQGIY